MDTPIKDTPIKGHILPTRPLRHTHTYVLHYTLTYFEEDKVQSNQMPSKIISSLLQGQLVQEADGVVPKTKYMETWFTKRPHTRTNVIQYRAYGTMCRCVTSVCVGVFTSVCVGVFMSVCVGVFTSVCVGVFTSVCVGVFMSVCVGAFTSVCVGVFMSVCVGAFTSVCVGVFMSVCVGVFVSVCSVCIHMWNIVWHTAHARTHTHTHTHTRTHARMHAHTHTHTHTHTHHTHTQELTSFT